MFMRQVMLLCLVCCAFMWGDAAGTTRYCPADTLIFDHNPQAGRFLLVRGMRMYVEVYGHGQPLLLIHGNGGSIASFYRNIPYFSQHYRVIAADSRAQGRSEDPEDSLSFEMMADDEAALLDSLHIPKAYVLGWSDGGIVALDLAIRHPSKVIKVASTGANLWPDSTALAPSVWMDMVHYYQQHKNDPRPDPAARNSWKIFMLDYDQPHIPLSALHGISCPALIMAGDHDLIRLQHTVAIYRNIPRAYLWIVPNSGHATLQEHTHAFNRMVNWFFQTPYSIPN